MRALSVRQAAQFFKLLVDETRLEVLRILARQGEVSVTALCEALKQSQPAVSHHLMLLRTGHLVSTRRQGHLVLYRIDDPDLRQLLDCLGPA